MSISRELTISCSCGSATHTFAIPESELPLASQLCSCDTSRRISGSLLTSYINVTHSISSTKPDLGNLTPYHSSDKLTRYFCSTCGTHMYLEYHGDGHFEAATGTLQIDSAKGIVNYKSCMWIEDTKDGGASDWLTNIGESDLEKWKQEAGKSNKVLLDYYDVSDGEAEQDRGPVHAHCHCKGVEFWITRPNTASKTARSDFPDLMVPYHFGREASRNLSDIPWWCQNNNDRFLAGTCACLSCRRASGFDITFWAFIPIGNIFLDLDLTQTFPPYDAGHLNEYWGTMKSYSSSEGVMRTFCAKCGANVFWDGGQAKGRDGLIDVAAGLLSARSGARAEELLAWWTKRVSFEEFAVNKSLARALSEGLKEWGRRKDRRVTTVVE